MDACLCELAVRFALKQFNRRRHAVYSDLEEWRAECAQIAWCTVLQYALETEAPVPETCSTGVHPQPRPWDSLETQEREWVHRAAHEALKALERFWYGEKSLRRRLVCFSDLSNASEGETDAEETHLPEELTASGVLDSIVADVDNQLLLEALRQRLSDSDWTIVTQLLEGRTQKEIAQMLGITPSAVCQRVRTIAKSCAEIRREIGLEL